MKYIGTKIINAIPMTRGEYNAYRGWTIPENETNKQDDEGFMVEDLGARNKNRENHDYYISWSPKENFEPAYRLLDNLTFGLAIEAMKKGHRVARAGWNGKGMFVVMQKGYPQGIYCNAQTAAAFGMKEGELFKCRPYLQLRCADGSHQMWQPSVSDCLEEDWFII